MSVETYVRSKPFPHHVTFLSSHEAVPVNVSSVQTIYGLHACHRFLGTLLLTVPEKLARTETQSETLGSCQRRGLHMDRERKCDKLSSRRVFQNLNGKSERWTISKKLYYITIHAEKYFLNDDISNNKFFSITLLDWFGKSNSHGWTPSLTRF